MAGACFLTRSLLVLSVPRVECWFGWQGTGLIIIMNATAAAIEGRSRHGVKLLHAKGCCKCQDL